MTLTEFQKDIDKGLREAFTWGFIFGAVFVGVIWFLFH